MGMACDADARGAGSPSSPGAGAGVVPNGGKGSQVPAPAAPTVGMNAEETALILASLSKGKFGPVAFAADDSDPEDHKHSDMEDLSGDDDDDEDDEEHGGGRVHRVQQINFHGPVGSKLDFMDDAGFSHRFRNESNRVKSLVTKHISIDELRAHFDRPIIDVAKDFGICITLMKKICRRNGIKRWPHRQIRSLSKSIASMEAAMLSTHGSEREKYRDQILSLKSKRESVIADPNKDSGVRPKTPTKDGSGMTRTNGSKLSPHGSHPQQQQPHGYGFVPVKADGASAGGFYAPHQAAASGIGSSSNGAPSHAKGGRWTSEEHAAFLEGIRLYGKDWRRVAQVVATRSAVQTRTHAQKYLLKFAGRFPFEAAADGGGGSAPKSSKHPHEAEQQQHDGAQASEDTEMASPSESATSYPFAQKHSMLTLDNHAKAPREAMAMILNSPDSVSSQASAGESPSVGLRLPPQQSIESSTREDVPMYSPMSTTSSMGRALPSLAMPAIKLEQRKLGASPATRDRESAKQEEGAAVAVEEEAP